MCPPTPTSKPTENAAQPQANPTIASLQEKRQQLEVKRQSISHGLRRSISHGLQSLSQRDLVDNNEQVVLPAHQGSTPLPAESAAKQHPEAEATPPTKESPQTLSIMEPTTHVDSSLVGLREKREKLQVTCLAFSHGLSALLDGHDEQLAQASARAASAKAEALQYKQEMQDVNEKAARAETDSLEYQRQVEDLRKQLAETKQVLEEKETQRATLQMNVEELGADNAGLKDTLKSMEHDFQAMIEAVETMTGQANSATEQIAELANRNHELEAEMLESRKIAKSLEQKLIEVEKANAHPLSNSQAHLVVPAFPVQVEDGVDDDEVFYFD